MGARRSQGERLPQWPSSGAEPPAPRALAAAAEAEPAQPPNPLPHPPAPTPPPAPRCALPPPCTPLAAASELPVRPCQTAAPRPLRTDLEFSCLSRVLSLGPSPHNSSPAAAGVPGPIHTPTFPALCSGSLCAGPAAAS
ncbi:uncharacterized protein [Saccopteryx bilineata]|uniref:uncharacterized protein n=1 Tax=Saccopteryx bilineata TaxID=59482 RepID=UPI00338FADEF